MQFPNYDENIRYWMYLERYVNDGSDHKFKDQSEVPERYRPGSELATIPLYALKEPYTKNEQTLPHDLYPIHPYTAKLYREMGHEVVKTKYRAIPSSSTRTILISDNNFGDYFLVKLDLPVIISRFDRSINKSDVTFSQQIDKELDDLHVNSPYSIGSFREVGGGHTKLNSGRNAGYIVRNPEPKWFCNPLPKNEYFLIPSFALISSDSRNQTAEKLLLRILRKSKDPKRVLVDRILTPLVDYWFTLAERGLIWELQQQNTLFVLDANGLPCGVVSRDYDGIYIDSAIRKKAGLSTAFEKHILSTKHELMQRYSFIFDHRLCKQNLMRIINCCAEYFDKDIAREVKDELKLYINNRMPAHIRELLPHDSWYTCPERMFSDGIVFIATPNPPLR